MWSRNKFVLLSALVLGIFTSSCGDSDSQKVENSKKSIKVSDWGKYPEVIVGKRTSAPSLSSTPSNVSKNYATAKGVTDCSVESASGAVSGYVAGVNNCKVVLTLSAKGYENLVNTYSISVKIGSAENPVWGNYDQVNVGESTSAPVLFSVSTDVRKVYSMAKDSIGCSVDPVSGSVTGIAAGINNCKIILTLFETGHDDLVHIYTISVKSRKIVVAGKSDEQKWGDYGTVRVGEKATSAPAIGATTPTIVSKSYTTGSGSTGCTVDSASGSITGNSYGTNNCKIVLTLSATNHANLVYTYTMSIQPGTQKGVRWNLTTTSVHVDDGELILSALSNVNASATVTYTVTDSGTTNCRFKGSAGINARTLMFDTAGTCRVKATVTRPEYNSWNSSVVDISVTNNPPVEITWTGYGNGSNTATFGQSAPSLVAPTLNPTTATATYSATGNACSVMSDGTLALLSVGSCLVTLTATPANNSNAIGTASVTVTVNKGNQVVPAVSNIYGSKPDLATGGTLNIIAAPVGGHGTVEYDSSNLKICQVDETTGTVTALLNGNCIIQARWSGNSNYNPSEWVSMQTIKVKRGTITIDDPGSFTGNLAVGGDTLTPGIPSITPSTATVSYSLDTGETDCTLVTPSTGEVRAANVEVTPGTTACTIVLTAALTGYNSLAINISVNLLKDSLSFNSPPSDGGNSLTLGGQLKLADIPAKDDNTVAVTWSFTATGIRDGNPQNGVCSVNNNSNNKNWGLVTAGSSAEVGDVCKITTTASAPGYESVALVLSLTLSHPNPVEITSRYAHSCVRFSNGGLKCWGNNADGQLGHGNQNHRGDNSNEMGPNLPWINLGANRSAKTVSVGAYHTCAILDDDSLKCWGDNRYGQLGVGISDYRATTPTAVDLGANKSAKMIATGGNHTCALLNDNSVKCWGGNSNGQLGYGDTANRNVPESNSTLNFGAGKSAQKIAAGQWHTCALLNDNSVKCWGQNYVGQLGIDSKTNVRIPTSVDLGEEKSAQEIFLGKEHSCAILNDNTLACWGNNSNSQAGIPFLPGTLDPKYALLVPHIVSFEQDNQYARSLSLGYTHSCAILNDDSLVCWGRGSGTTSNKSVNGQLGYENTDNQSTPPETGINLGTDKTATKVTTGHGFTCALLDDHTVKCWGVNPFGELGAEDNAVVWGDESGEMGDNLQTVPLR